MAGILKSLGLDGRKTLVLMPEYNETVCKSGRNIPVLRVMEAAKASTYDILDSQTVVLQKTALKKIEETLG